MEESCNKVAGVGCTGSLPQPAAAAASPQAETLTIAREEHVVHWRDVPLRSHAELQPAGDDGWPRGKNKSLVSARSMVEGGNIYDDALQAAAAVRGAHMQTSNGVRQRLVTFHTHLLRKFCSRWAGMGSFPLLAAFSRPIFARNSSRSLDPGGYGARAAAASEARVVVMRLPADIARKKKQDVSAWGCIGTSVWERVHMQDARPTR